MIVGYAIVEELSDLDLSDHRGLKINILLDFSITAQNLSFLLSFRYRYLFWFVSKTWIPPK